MHASERARKIAATIQRARPGAHDGADRRVAQPGMGSGRSRTCLACGHRSTEQLLIVERPGVGRRAIEERTLHYLRHGITSQEIGDSSAGEPAHVEVDLADWERFLGLADPAAP